MVNTTGAEQDSVNHGTAEDHSAKPTTALTGMGTILKLNHQWKVYIFSNILFLGIQVPVESPTADGGESANLSMAVSGTGGSVEGDSGNPTSGPNLSAVAARRTFLHFRSKSRKICTAEMSPQEEDDKLMLDHKVTTV